MGIDRQSQIGSRAWAWCLALCWLVCLCAPAQAERINIAAIVNDDVVTTTDVNDRRDLLMALNGMPDTIETQQRLTPRILDSLINETLQMQEAKRQSITIGQEEIDGALAKMESARHQAPGSLKSFIDMHHLSLRSLEAQTRAELAWTKVVQRKLKRNVSISEDEIARAQQAEAAAPGVAELRIAAVSLPIVKPADAPTVAKLAAQMQSELAAGDALGTVAMRHATQDNMHVSPPVWMREDELQPALQQALRNLKPGEVTPPLRNTDSYQLIQLIDRQVTKPLPDNTEVVVKELRLDLPPKDSKDALEQLRQKTQLLRSNPGGCTDVALGPKAPVAAARFLRTTLAPMPSSLRSVVSHLGVGDISDPIITETGIELVMLCERIEPPTTGLPDAEKIRQKLFTEKIDLEAEKYLRNLRRDAFLEIKTADAPAP